MIQKGFLKEKRLSAAFRYCHQLPNLEVANQGGQPALDKKEGESCEKLDKALVLLWFRVLSLGWGLLPEP